jgi:cell division septation protein DedD
LLSSAFGVEEAKAPKLMKAAQHVQIGSLIAQANREASAKGSKLANHQNKKAKITAAKQVSVMKASSSKSKWKIQVGAFTRAKDAQAALRKAGAKITALTRKQRTPHVAAAGKRKKLFKAQFVNMSPVQAKQSCSQVKKSGLECLIIKG